MIPYVQNFALTLNKFLEHAAKWHPDAGVVTATGGGAVVRTSYKDLLAASRRFSRGLIDLGIAPGDRVATLAWNTCAHIEAWYGVSGIGAIVHTLNPRLSPDTLAAMVRKAECRMIVVSASLAEMAVGLAQLCPSVERVIVIDEAADVAALQSPVPVHLHGDVAGDNVSGEVVWGEFDENTPAGLCFTSGTTGDPKGVV